MMKYMNALYEARTQFSEADDFHAMLALDTAIDLWDGFNKPIDPKVSVPRLYTALKHNIEVDADSRTGYQTALELLRKHYPECLSSEE